MVLEEEKKKKRKKLKAKVLHCEENSIFLKWNWFTDYLKAERSHLTHTVSLPYTHTHIPKCSPAQQVGVVAIHQSSIDRTWLRQTLYCVFPTY